MAPLPKVILTEHLDSEAADWLAERVDLVRCRLADGPGLLRELQEAQGLLVRTYTQVDEALLAAAPKLRVVARAGVGLDNIDLGACQNRNVRVVFTPDANTQAVVEYVWALMLDHLRPRATMADYVTPPKFHDMRKEHVGRQCDRLQLGILGMGRIGRRVAEVAHALGMRVGYHDLLSRAALHLPDDEPSEFLDRDSLLAESDILTLHVDGRAENRGLIDARALGRLKKSCLLINTSRGFVVDPQALADWANKVHPHGGGAVIDVHEPEPPDDAHPLWGLDNVRLLPHLASRTATAMKNMSWVVRDLVRVLRDQTPDHPAV